MQNKTWLDLISNDTFVISIAFSLQKQSWLSSLMFPILKIQPSAIFLCVLYGPCGWQLLQLKLLVTIQWDQQQEIFIHLAELVVEAMELSTRWDRWTLGHFLVLMFIVYWLYWLSYGHTLHYFPPLLVWVKCLFFLIDTFRGF